MQRIAFTTLGCKTNQYDTACMIAACRRAGFEVVPFDDEADAYVINTCTVTRLADAQGRQLIRRAKRHNPAARVIACGCYAQNGAPELQTMSELDAVFGVRCADEVVAFLQSVILTKVRIQEQSKLDVPTDQPRARALLKIQDGCDKRCTYCAVWRARGKSVSAEHDTVITGYRSLGRYPEVMLTGIHVGQYGRDLDPRSSLGDLIGALLDQSDGPRVRLNSLDPDECDERLIALLTHPRLCRHVHLSVQSGDDEMLRSMGRAYTRDDIRHIVTALATRIPGIAIGVDLIVGFPGEHEEQHRRTMALIQDLPISFLHVFPFSPRPDTRAACMPNHVTRDEKRRRVRELLQVGAHKKMDYVQGQIGCELEGVVISRRPDDRGLVRAVSDNYVTMRVSAEDAVYKDMRRARITHVHDGEVFARWI